MLFRRLFLCALLVGLLTGLLDSVVQRLPVVPLSLPPELPGMQAAPLQARQLWWALTVACGAGGLAMLCLVRAKWRVLGLGLLVLPFAVGAPQHQGSPFAGLGAEAAAQMELLAGRFAVATTLASALQWLLLG